MQKFSNERKKRALEILQAFPKENRQTPVEDINENSR